MPVLPHPHTSSHISHNVSRDDHSKSAYVRSNRSHETETPDTIYQDIESQTPLASDSTADQPTSPSKYTRNEISPDDPFREPQLRKLKRAPTARVFAPERTGRSWRPGQEPGIDPYGEQPSRVPLSLKEECEITMVDFGRDRMSVQNLDNSSLANALDQPRPEGLNCRWISVNGLSWDVISLLGRKMNFHRLAVEDLVHRGARTKVDWYSDHIYVSLAMQKLVHIDKQQYGNDEDPKKGFVPMSESLPFYLQEFGTGLGRLLRRKKAENKTDMHEWSSGSSSSIQTKPNPTKSPSGDISNLPPAVRTIQRYNGGQNEERTALMEAQSPLRQQNLAVSIEQVAIFLTSDNTIVTFFEQSSEDVEDPILNRISSADTVLRRTSEASMVLQAVIDAIVDLAIPVALAYKGVIDELELHVLTGRIPLYIDRENIDPV